MLVAGCANSLLTKFQDNQCVANCSGDTSESAELFNQPVLQTVQMFVAEALVALVVLTERYYMHRQKMNRYQQLVSDNSNEHSAITGRPVTAETLVGRRVFLLAAPAVCDVCGTTLMNVGLLTTPVSVFQMIRGSVVLFVGAFSVLFLKRSLSRKQWLGLIAITVGIFIVGFSASSDSSAKKSISLDYKILFGVLLILLAQIFTSSQFVIEEALLEKYSLQPIKVVAWEGFFGTAICIFVSLLTLFVFALFASQTDDSMTSLFNQFNLMVGIEQVFASDRLLVSSVAIILSLATFNVAGVTVTRLISATSRSTIDSCRTIGIWMISLLLGWESFRVLQLVGFALLIYGTLVFNGIVHSDNKNSNTEAAQKLRHNDPQESEETHELLEVDK